MPFDATDFQPTTVDPLTITEPKERLRYLAEFLRGLPDEKFDMAELFEGAGPDGGTPHGKTHAECGTVACIAGWALFLFDPLGSDTGAGSAEPLLGLSSAQGDELFLPPGYPIRGFATAAQAARVLDHLIATGEVDWSKARA